MELKNIFIDNFTSEDNFFNSLENLVDKDLDILLRKVFDISRETGLKMLNKKGSKYSQSEIIDFLEGLNIGCISGKWEYKLNQKAFNLSRNCCPYSGSDTVCQYFREALDGFVMGIGDTERYSRHKSIKYGLNDVCTDVIYDSDYSDLRWGEVPLEIQNIITKKFKKLLEKGIEIIPKGFSEKTLFYVIKDLNEDLSPFRRKFVIETFENKMRENFSDLELFEISPRAVIEGEF